MAAEVVAVAEEVAAEAATETETRPTQEGAVEVDIKEVVLTEVTKIVDMATRYNGIYSGKILIT